jgi:hypothetical protein
MEAKNGRRTYELGEPLVSYAELAEKFRVSTRTVESPGFLNRLGLRPVRVGRTVRFDPADVRAAVERLKGRRDGA